MKWVVGGETLQKEGQGPLLSGLEEGCVKGEGGPGGCLPQTSSRAGRELELG